MDSTPPGWDLGFQVHAGARALQRLRSFSESRTRWISNHLHKQILGMRGCNGMPMMAVAAAAIVVTTTFRGDESLLCYDGLQPLHARPIQVLSRPLPRIPFWL